MENLSSLSLDNSVYHKKSDDLKENNIQSNSQYIESVNNEQNYKPENADITTSQINIDENIDEVSESFDHSLEETASLENIDSAEILEGADDAETSESDISMESLPNDEEEIEKEEPVEKVADHKGEAKASVRRLSLFDSLDIKEEDIPNDLVVSKNEPTLQEDNNTEETENSTSSNEEEFSAEEPDIEEEFNQESEEELLDIPTFLRRQAN